MYHIYHHNDADGKLSAAILKNFLETNGGRNISFYSINYDQEMDIFKINDDDTVFIVDYSLSNDDHREKVLKVKEKCKLYWFDHHISSLKLEEKYPELKEINGLRCTTLSQSTQLDILCNIIGDIDNFNEAKNFMNLNGLSIAMSNLPLVIKLINDWDTSPRPLMFGDDSIYMKTYIENSSISEISTFLNNIEHPSILKISSVYEEDALNYGKEVIKVIKSLEDNMVTDIYTINFEGFEIPAINANVKSNFFDRFKKEDYPMFMAYHRSGSRWVYSIYSGYLNNMNEIAEKYYGGGHPGAAGFNSDTLYDFVNPIKK